LVRGDPQRRPVDAVEANFPRGPEYYIRNGINSIGFGGACIATCSATFIRRRPAVAAWVSRLENSGSRQTVALGMRSRRVVAFAAP